MYLITMKLIYDLGLSFFSLYNARSDTLATLTTWKGILSSVTVISVT